MKTEIRSECRIDAYMKKNRNLKKRILIAAEIFCLMAALICTGVICLLADTLDSQKAAERWQGDSELAFEQLSCFLPEDQKISLNDIYAFRTAAEDEIHKAALDIASEDQLYVDAWSTSGKVLAETDKGSCDCSVLAVGGEYFTMHPIKLKAGNYLTGHDLMQDRIMLDKEVAWRLFGGYDLQGCVVRINGEDYVVAGVIEREDDFASAKAYTAGMGIYMSLEGYTALAGETGISCYEIVLPEPVDGFAKGVVEDKFPVGRGEIVDNTERFKAGSLFRLIGQFGVRSMQTRGVIYPYWENAARYIEDWCALLMLAGIVFAVLPVGTVIVLAVRLTVKGKTALEEELIPKAKDSVEEAVRVRQRRRWEKKHGIHEK